MTEFGSEEHTPRACDGALTEAFTFLGKRWNGVILATLQGEARGFADLRRSVDGISDSILSERLSELARRGLVDREVESGPPVTVRYRLTPSGVALMPVMGDLARWSRGHLSS